MPQPSKKCELAACYTKRHATDPHNSTVWLDRGDSLTIFLVVQARPDRWEGGRIAMTAFVDWEARAEVIDLEIPADLFATPKFYEVAIAIRGRGTTSRTNSAFKRYGVYAGSAHRSPHPCVPAGERRDLSTVFSYEDYGTYLVGRHNGLVYPAGTRWEDLPLPKEGTAGEVIAFQWFTHGYTSRNSAFVPIVNGLPVAAVSFGQLIKSRSRMIDLAHEGAFNATLPSADVADVYVAEWPDPYYPPRLPEGEPTYFPDDAPEQAGLRVNSGNVNGGTNALRYILSP